MSYLRLKILTLLLLVCLGASAVACQVPVFRYALERWTSDKYEIVILHEGPLAPEHRRQLEPLQSPQQRQLANYEIQVAEVSQLRDERLLRLWQERTEKDQPLMVVLYPRNAMEVPDRLLQTLPFNEQALTGLVDSPAREEIARRLSAGQSAVWIFIPSGEPSKDAPALKALNERIKVNQSHLTLPTAEELEIDAQVLASNKLPLRIEFSVVELDRRDPREAFLVRALEQSEADLPTSEPMAFPVFGRGRVLYALLGKGIMPETIDAACTFMVGPCSCQVKNQNPGFDLLLSHDWENAVSGSMISVPIPEETKEPVLLTIPPGRKK